MIGKYISSPLNYIGGKHKLLPQIIPLFPKNISTFVDLFCGSCNVGGINVNSEKVIFNDNLTFFRSPLKTLDFLLHFPRFKKFLKKIEFIGHKSPPFLRFFREGLAIRVRFLHYTAFWCIIIP